ncbi:MAG: ABC transporter permease [Phycisphaerales bacterium]|nr:ABC transporter permease [Phycisphaerales bacterium]
MSDSAGTSRPAAPVRRAVEAVGSGVAAAGRRVVLLVSEVGAMGYLLADTVRWMFRTGVRRKARFGWGALADQAMRVGVRSIGIVVLVEMFIGCILALQLAPTLESYGQLERISEVIAIAIFRELGPLMTAIVLSGFAGASIAAEIGAMVEAEELKALRAHAINPIRYLIMPRFLAAVVMIVGLAVIADVVGVIGGLLTSYFALGINPETYLYSTREALFLRDFLTGLVKAGVFGGLIALIACHQGLSVKGGAVGVGSATTATVVKSIVAIIGMDAVFTTAFYAFGL